MAFIPEGYVPDAGAPVKVVASFYVDEAGRVRLPSIESAPSPALIPNAIRAVEHWQFKPPTMGGQPVLVFTTWAVKFVAFPERPGPGTTGDGPWDPR